MRLLLDPYGNASAGLASRIADFDARFALAVFFNLPLCSGHDWKCLCGPTQIQSSSSLTE
jgi:hypothetical protein